MESGEFADYTKEELIEFRKFCELIADFTIDEYIESLSNSSEEEYNRTQEN